MKDIFTDLYKKLAGFFQATEEEKKDESKNVACNRLKFVLMQDRTNLNPYLLERMRSEMIDVLSKYVEMDKEALELSFEQEGESMALMLSIPVIRAKEEDEIQAIIKAEEEAKAANAAKEAEAKTTEEETEEAQEESFEEDATETVDAESEEAEVEEVCTCNDDDDNFDNDEDDDDEEDDSTCSCDATAEETPSKKSKKK
jgi:cell division topological specificity factor